MIAAWSVVRPSSRARKYSFFNVIWSSSMSRPACSKRSRWTTSPLPVGVGRSISCLATWSPPGSVAVAGVVATGPAAPCCTTCVSSWASSVWPAEVDGSYWPLLKKMSRPVVEAVAWIRPLNSSAAWPVWTRTREVGPEAVLHRPAQGGVERAPTAACPPERGVGRGIERAALHADGRDGGAPDPAHTCVSVSVGRREGRTRSPSNPAERASHFRRVRVLGERLIERRRRTAQVAHDGGGDAVGLLLVLVAGGADDELGLEERAGPALRGLATRQRLAPGPLGRGMVGRVRVSAYTLSSHAASTSLGTTFRASYQSARIRLPCRNPVGPCWIADRPRPLTMSPSSPTSLRIEYPDVAADHGPPRRAAGGHPRPPGRHRRRRDRLGQEHAAAEAVPRARAAASTG